jgi:nucleoid-associated protein YgaU
MADAGSPHRLRLTRRGRIVFAVLVVLAVCGLFVAGASAAQASGPTAAHGAPGAAHGAPGAAGQVIVQPGDSLWSIAQSADPNADARAIVQQILQANRLRTADVTAGQRLWVPRG